MTSEEATRLANLETDALGLFADAAERRRAYDAWSGNEASRPIGTETSAEEARLAVAQWRDLAAQLDVLTDPPADPDSVEGEPEGLSNELSLLYRQFMAQVAAVE